MWYLLTTGKRVKEKGRKRAPLTACDIPISCSVHPNPPVEIASQNWVYIRAEVYLLSVWVRLCTHYNTNRHTHTSTAFKMMYVHTTINATKSLSSFQYQYYNAYLGSRETPQTHAHIKGKYIHMVHPILSLSSPYFSLYTWLLVFSLTGMLACT